MYQKGDSDAELAAFGFTPADYGDGGDVEVWPENHAAFNIFRRVSTQWRSSMGGAIGLDYGSLYPLMARLNLEPDAWDELLDDIQILERAALEAMHEKT